MGKKKEKKSSDVRLNKVKFSINVKATILVLIIVLLSFAAALVVSILTYTFMAISISVFGDRMLGRTLAITIDQDVASGIYKEGKRIYDSIPEEDRLDPDASDYLSRYTQLKDDDYLTLKAQLTRLAETNDLEWIDLRLLDKEHSRYVYLLDTEQRYDMTYAMGAWVYEEDSVYTFMKNDTDRDAEEVSIDVDILTSMTIQGTISGKDIFCTLAPFYDLETGECIGYIGIGEQADIITQEVHVFIWIYICIAGFFVIMVLLVSRKFIKSWIIKPVRKLTKAAREYAKTTDKLHSEPVFSNVGIKTKDEIRLLADSMSDMELDLKTYIQNLTSLTAKHERIEAELGVAEEIQTSMLPGELTGYEGVRDFDINTFIKPAREVGGDFYDYFVIDNDHIGLTIADVSGKGVPAALFMAISKTLLKNAAMEDDSPARIVEKVNRQLCETNPEMMFVTVWFGIYTVSTHTLVYANAGHEYPALYRKSSGRYELIVEEHDIVLGFEPSLTFNEFALTLEPGDKLFLYTDGIPEATDTAGELFGTDRMIRSLDGCSSSNGKAVFDALTSDIRQFISGAEQFDDMTMLLLEVNEGAE